MTAEQINELKSKIKAEMLRRNGHGSLESYGDSSYDFDVIPVTGEKVLVEHGKKTVDLLLKIEDYEGLYSSVQNERIPTSFNEELLTEIERLAQEKKTGLTSETSSCRGDCTGLCVGSCHGLCNGCSGCSATCGTGCASGCNSACTGGCLSACTGAKS